MNKATLKRIQILIPSMGILLFILLYIVATLLYPGGSPFDKSTVGFSWLHNYWCNLLNKVAINGQKNAAQPLALIALFTLCFSLGYFWVSFPLYAVMRKVYSLSIQIFGTTAMCICLLLFTDIDHDLITNLASFFGFLALGLTLRALYQHRWRALLCFGVVNVLLVMANNILYYNPALIVYLPVVQKITFASMLTWIVCINAKMFTLSKDKPLLSEVSPPREDRL